MFTFRVHILVFDLCLDIGDLLESVFFSESSNVAYLLFDRETFEFSFVAYF
jgi:hypothetical protein